MPSRLLKWSASVRVDQCESPESAGGDILVKAITRARARGGTCVRGPPRRLPSSPAKPRSV